jgi:hypothetical protein
MTQSDTLSVRLLWFGIPFLLPSQLQAMWPDFFLTMFSRLLDGVTGFEKDISGFSVPFVSVAADVIIYMARSQRNSTNPRAIVSLDDTDGDTPWRKVLAHPAFFVFATAEAVLSCLVCCLVLLKLRDYDFLRTITMRNWAEINLPHCCLFLEFIGGALRFCYWSIDPLSSRFVIPYIGHIPFRTISIPFTLASTLLLTFYWYETVTVRFFPLRQTRSVSLTLFFLEYEYDILPQRREISHSLLCLDSYPLCDRNCRRLHLPWSWRLCRWR